MNDGTPLAERERVQTCPFLGRVELVPGFSRARMRWFKVSEEAATQHSLHEFRGWLAVFVVATTIGLLCVVADILTTWSAYDNLGTVLVWAPPAWKALLIGNVTLAVWLFALLVRTSPSLRGVFPWLQVGPAGVGLLFNVAVVESLRSSQPVLAQTLYTELPEVIWSAAGDLIGAVVFCTYAHLSRRYRLIFEQCVREDDPLVAINPSYSVRPDGAVHQWRKEPPRELSVGSGS